MSEFEFLAVFVSIIFGISVTHILSGVMRSFYRGEFEETHLVFTVFLFLVLVLNWWTSFAWSAWEVWSFEIFIVIILWSVAHYVAAITLYPPLSYGVGKQFEYRRRWFLWAFIAVCLTDILQAAASGRALVPWYYLPFVLHYVVLSVIAIILRQRFAYRFVAWYLLVSVTLWAFVVRRFLA